MNTQNRIARRKNSDGHKRGKHGGTKRAHRASKRSAKRIATAFDFAHA